jgi:hypothetical protein
MGTKKRQTKQAAFTPSASLIEHALDLELLGWIKCSGCKNIPAKHFALVAAAGSGWDLKDHYLIWKDY